MFKLKKSHIKKFKKPKFVPKPTVDVITLSDSEDSKDHIEIVDKPAVIIAISESSSSEDDDTSVEVVTIDDDSPLCDKNCIGFCFHTETPDYIPINGEILNTRKRKRFTKRKRFSPFPEKQLNCKGKPIIKLEQPNIFNVEESIHLGLRPVIIDGSNVAFGFGNGEFQIQGVIIVIQFFLSRGHEDITCFLPAHYRHKCRTPSEDKILNVYEKDRIIAYTPSRKLYGRSIVPYDDRFIVQYASERKGVIISNDAYKDLLKEDANWKDTIERRIINYTFVRGVFMLPKDPLGPEGPTLDEMLKFP